MVVEAIGTRLAVSDVERQVVGVEGKGARRERARTEGEIHLQPQIAKAQEIGVGPGLLRIGAEREGIELRQRFEVKVAPESEAGLYRSAILQAAGRDGGRELRLQDLHIVQDLALG